MYKSHVFSQILDVSYMTVVCFKSPYQSRLILHTPLSLTDKIFKLFNITLAYPLAVVHFNVSNNCRLCFNKTAVSPMSTPVKCSYNLISK